MKIQIYHWYKKLSPYIKYSIIASIIVVGFWGLSWWLIVSYFKPEHRGIFGDMFGAVNALFSGLAFAGIIITILLQHQELKETRDEFIEQNKTLRLQRFENTFFNLMSLHNELKIENKGNSFFKGILHRLTLEGYDNRGIQGLRIYYREKFKEHDTSNYLQGLKTIYNTITLSTLLSEEAEREIYYGILKDSLSKSERIFLLFYLALAEKDATKNTLLHMEDKLKFAGTVSRDDIDERVHYEDIMAFLNNALQDKN